MTPLLFYPFFKLHGVRLMTVVNMISRPIPQVSHKQIWFYVVSKEALKPELLICRKKNLRFLNYVYVNIA
jgi:hypothetical protein